ncbi:hypothetical protein QQX98_003982 [Neonectria punicea]|uniref:Ubiquitin carrier protein n=1 Tax=Neonectria punicea TaxID=979145 RepID=A0ABR1HB18_9HYPO
MLSHVGPALMRRAVDFARDTASHSPSDPDSGAPHPQPPAWIWFLYFADILLLFPIVIFANYTLEKVLPVFAIVEDENPPAYEPVALDDEASGSVRADPIAIGLPTPGNNKNKTASVATPTRPLVQDAFPITSSFRASLRLLRSHGGVPAFFRAFGCFLFQAVVHAFIAGLFMGVLGAWFSPVGSLIASLLLVQYNTAWVHIVMTPRSPLHFWKRLPAFRSTFEATWRPVLLFWFSGHLAAWAPWLIAVILHFEIPSWNGNAQITMPTMSDNIKLLITILFSIVVQLFIVVPAYVSLVRVQASLLPDTQETIIPFDRTFQGKVEPAIVSGMGYVSLTDAWTTFSRAAWRRLVILYVKVVAASIGVTFLAFAVFSLQWALIVGFVKN